MTNDETTSDLEELAALYAAGVLPPDEAAAVESRLDEGDLRLAGEIASYGAVLAAIAEGSEPTVPGPETRERLLEQIARMAPGRERARGDDRIDEASAVIIFRRGQSREWVDLDIPGIQECLLYRDPGRNIETKLIRVAPGFPIPGHPHPGVEECFLLEGDLHTYGKVLTAGDYMVAPPDSVHPESYTEKGCLLLVTVIGRAGSGS